MYCHLTCHVILRPHCPALGTNNPYIRPGHTASEEIPSKFLSVDVTWVKFSHSSKDWTWQLAGTAQFLTLTEPTRQHGQPWNRADSSRTTSTSELREIRHYVIMLKHSMEADMTGPGVIFTCETCPALYLHATEHWALPAGVKTSQNILFTAKIKCDINDVNTLETNDDILTIASFYGRKAP